MNNTKKNKVWSVLEHRYLLEVYSSGGSLVTGYVTTPSGRVIQKNFRGQGARPRAEAWCRSEARDHEQATMEHHLGKATSQHLDGPQATALLVDLIHLAIRMIIKKDPENLHSLQRMRTPDDGVNLTWYIDQDSMRNTSVAFCLKMAPRWSGVYAGMDGSQAVHMADLLRRIGTMLTLVEGWRIRLLKATEANDSHE